MDESIAANIDDESAGTMYSYQILAGTQPSGDEGYRIWKSTGPLSGGFLKASEQGEWFDVFDQALSALALHIKNGE
jgi:hypothetical protein